MYILVEWFWPAQCLLFVNCHDGNDSVSHALIVQIVIGTRGDTHTIVKLGSHSGAKM